MGAGFLNNAVALQPLKQPLGFGEKRSHTGALRAQDKTSGAIGVFSKPHYHLREPPVKPITNPERRQRAY
eukprot:15464508-Alexandrium_andersonii.AAC.1